MHNYDPVHQNQDGTWWFWDECQCDEYGPYDSERIARLEIARYACIHLEGMLPIHSPDDIQPGMLLVNLEERPFLEKYQQVIVAAIGKNNEFFDVRLNGKQVLVVHRNDYRCFVRKS